MAAAAKDVYDNDNDNEQLEAWFGDRRAHARMCDALARMCDASLLFLPVRRGRRERALALLSKEKGRAKE